MEYIFNKMKLKHWNELIAVFKAYIAFLQHDYSSNCYIMLAAFIKLRVRGISVFNIRIICNWQNFDTYDGMIC